MAEMSGEIDMAPEDPVLLSPEGLARKEAMLRDLRAGALAAIVVAAAVAIRTAVEPPREPAIAVPAPPPAAPRDPERGRPATAPRITVVRDDPGALDRARIGDEELIALLRAAGRPAGIVRSGGKLIVPGAVK